jgi:hypothetical protein
VRLSTLFYLRREREEQARGRSFAEALRNPARARWTGLAALAGDGFATQDRTERDRECVGTPNGAAFITGLRRAADCSQLVPAAKEPRVRSEKSRSSSGTDP